MPVLRVSPSEIETIRANGGLTFRNLSCGKCRCNQLPHLGRIGKKQRDTLRSMIWPRRHEAKPTTAAESSTPRKFASYYDKVQQGAVRRPISTPIPAPAPRRSLYDDFGTVHRRSIFDSWY